MGQHVKDVIKEKEKNEEEAVPSMVIYLPLEDSALRFNLEKAVCNHGFFMMAPNQWIPSIKTLQRPLYLADSTISVVVQISHPKKNDHLHVLVLGTNFLSPQDQKVLLTQIARMLRISKKDERKMQKFHEIHFKAKKKSFGRLFRSPSLFEDMVKTILLCASRKKNCSMKTAEEYTEKIYGKYAPFQCLAYWLELVKYYEKEVGKLSQLPHSSYHLVTGSIDITGNNS